MDIKQIKKQLSRVGLQDRETQIEMMESIHKAITEQKVLCIEAPTGTGKTLSYSIAGYLSRQKKQALIISTSTIALQEQLIKKDLPLLSRMLGESISFALAKGRRRYVCHNRLLNPNWTQDIFDADDDFDTLRRQLERREWNGDRDELDISIDEQSWRKISTDASGCSGKLCDYHEECAFFNARKKLHQADIIVTNHSLLLSDLELGGGAILPEPEKSIYVIDECHHLPEKALSHFAKSDTLMGSVDWINNLTKTLTNAIKADQITEDTQKNLNALTHDLIQALSSMRTMLVDNEAQFNDDVWRLKDIPEEIFELAKTILSFGSSIMMQCEIIYADLEEKVKQKSISPDDKSTLEKLISSLGFSSSRAQNLFETWSLFCHQRKEKEAPVARWFEKRGDTYFCHASPINISKRLTELFWDKAKNGLVLCSATIRALGKFDDFRRKTGLTEISRCEEKAIASCFDYQQSLLYIPSMQHEPVGFNQDAHRDEVIALLPDLMLPKTGTLVLFTSRFSMNKSYDAMPASCSKDILIQTQHNKNKLIEKHKKRIRQGKRSIIFGLASFGEGLDLPADFCQHVIIHKLPFAVPSTPIELTRNEWLKSNQLNAFMVSSLPNASVRLTQFVGRLIRQENDIGIVTILDKRIYSKKYGSYLLANLPDFQQCINQDLDTLKNHVSTQKLWQ